jgi:hypothetical protein
LRLEDASLPGWPAWAGRFSRDEKPKSVHPTKERQEVTVMLQANEVNDGRACPWFLHGKWGPWPLVVAAVGTWGCGGNPSDVSGKTTDDAGALGWPADATRGGDVEKAAADSETGPTLTAISLKGSTFMQWAVYTATVTIGDSQSFQMQLDTGSNALAVASKACTTCGVSPEYTPTPTGNTHQSANAEYGPSDDLEGYLGEIYQGTVRLATGPSTPNRGLSASIDFVSITSQSQFFLGNTYQGIMGMAPAGSACVEVPGTDELFGQLVSRAHVPDVFATELCGTTGTLWLGGYDPAATTAAPRYTPLITEGGAACFWAVNLVSIEIAGSTVPIATTANPATMLDTGTPATILPAPAFTAITEAIGTDANFQQVFGFEGGDKADGGDAGAVDAGTAASWFANTNSCTNLTQTKAELDAMLPPMTLIFGSSSPVTVQSPATESYLFGVDGCWYPALFSESEIGSLPSTIGALLGLSPLRSNVVIFDRAHKQVGFAPHAPCP